MTNYLELHMELEKRRAAASSSISGGPRVLVAGPSDTGKSSVCRLLANYVARCGSGAILVDLDIGQGEFSVPGCISAVPVHRPLDIEVLASALPALGDGASSF
jgi:polyribonucleotide 5'-hydroxyl-kinase